MKHWQDIVSTTVLVGGGGIIILVLAMRGGFNLTSLISNAPATSPTQPTSITSAVLTPKEVVQRYYQLAPTNKAAAIELLSEPWRKAEQSKGHRGPSFWDSINRVDVYALKTLAESQKSATVRVWLKYYPKGTSDASCESMTFQIIFDSRVNQWLLDSVSDVVQETGCST